MGQDQSQVFLALSCGVQTPLRVIICGGFKALGVTEWAGGAEGALKRKARQSHSRLMLSESERSCHVFWQLTRLVWILQHKAGTVVCMCVSTHLLGNVPLGYFCIDLITLRSDKLATKLALSDSNTSRCRYLTC